MIITQIYFAQLQCQRYWS